MMEVLETTIEGERYRLLLERNQMYQDFLLVILQTGFPYLTRHRVNINSHT